MTRFTAPGPLPAEALRVLALDTSTERLAVALSTPQGHHLANEAGGAAASAALLPIVQVLLRRAGCDWSALQALAFARGPGAFTGLRTACAVVQGLALGLDLPVLPLDSLLVVAEDARVQAGVGDEAGHEPWQVAVAMDARMDEAYAAIYRWQAGSWQTLREPALLGLPALQAMLDGVALQALAGSAPAAYGPRLSLPAVPLWPHEADRAAALLRLALHAAQAGAALDAADALPLYLRDKVAFTTQERDAARRAAVGAAAAAGLR